MPQSKRRVYLALPSNIESVDVRMVVVLAAALLVTLLLTVVKPDLTMADPAVAGLEIAINAANEPPLLPPAGGDTFHVLSPIFTSEVLFWEDRIVGWADQFDLDPNLVAIIMQVESCGDPGAVSSAGARGLFQVMPFHFLPGEDALDPDTNALRGLAYFNERLKQTGGDLGRAFAGYNGGHVAAAGNWSDWVNETQRYYVWTTGLYQDIEQGMAESPTLNSWLQAGGASLCRQAAERIGL